MERLETAGILPTGGILPGADKKPIAETAAGAYGNDILENRLLLGSGVTGCTRK